MIDPYEDRSRRARELLVSAIFVTISCALVVVAAYYTHEQMQDEGVGGVPPSQMVTRFEPKDVVSILMPDIGDCYVYETREAYRKALGSGTTVPSGRAPDATSAEGGFKVPSGTHVMVIQHVTGGPVEVEVIKGPEVGRRGFVSPRWLAR
jgi:hypothetical protein